MLAQPASAGVLRDGGVSLLGRGPDTFWGPGSARVRNLVVWQRQEASQGVFA